MWVQSPGREDPLGEEMETHSSILAWRNPWTEEPGGLQSAESQRVRQDCSDLAHTGCICFHATCYSLHPSQPLFTPRAPALVHRPVMYVCVSTAALQIGHQRLVNPCKRDLHQNQFSKYCETLFREHRFVWIQLLTQNQVKYLTEQQASSYEKPVSF